jgi:putative nucleotidyltransferase with HDIG domain
MDEVPTFRSSISDRLKRAWHATRLWLIFGLGLAGVLLVLSLPSPERQTSFALQIGDVAPQDIAAPYPLTYTSEVLTTQARQAAAEAVADIYDPPDSGVARQQLERLRASLDFIDSVRADQFGTTEERLADLEAMADVRLDAATSQTLLDMPEARWQAIKLESISVLEQVMRSEIREGRTEAARRTVPALVSIAMPESQAALVAKLAAAFVAPNARYNAEATQRARDEAGKQVAPAAKSYAAGETIVARGQLVSDLQYEALQAYGLLKAPQAWRDILLRLLLLLVLGGSIALYAYRVHPEQAQSSRIALMTSALFILETLGMQLMIPGRTILPYVFPAATLPVLLAVIYGPGMGVLAALVGGAIAGYMAPRGLELGLYFMLSGTLACLVIGKAERMGSFFWAGVAAALGATAVIIVFRISDPATDLVGKASLAGAAVLSGLLSASLAFGVLLLLGNILGVTTNVQLIELSRPDHPLLQYILRNAPGTYQHSLQVANLAEQAARAIGANPLLVRVGALYHDAGKALKPQFFIENQVPGQNIHQQLDPTTSAGVIISHVKEGLDLARKYRLPKSVQDFIPQHHGTLEASYQYRAALEAAGEARDRIDRRDFAYPGPRPRTREAAILMLADGVEAKARAESPADENAIDELVHWVIQDRLDRGQLDRTNLTLKDLDTIRKAFVLAIKGIYHPRIRYPDGGATAPKEEIRDAQPSFPTESRASEDSDPD